MRNVDQSRAVSKRAVDGGVHGALRDGSEVPRGAGGVALAERLRLSGLRR